MDVASVIFDEAIGRGRQDGACRLDATSLEEMRDYVDRQLDVLLAKVELGSEVDPADLTRLPMEVFLKLLVLSAISSVGSDRDLCRLGSVDADFRAFLGLAADAGGIDAAVFSRMRRKLRRHPLTWECFRQIIMPVRSLCVARHKRVASLFH